MDSRKKTVEVLNDLLMINNDRIAGYEKAIKEIDYLDIGLKGTFENMRLESEKYRKELTSLMYVMNFKPEDETTTMGEIYRMWMDIKSAVMSNDKTTILELCEQGEDAALKAYNKVLEKRNDVLPEALDLVSKQKEGLQRSHDLIRNLRDSNRRAA